MIHTIIRFYFWIIITLSVLFSVHSSSIAQVFMSDVTIGGGMHMILPMNDQQSSGLRRMYSLHGSLGVLDTDHLRLEVSLNFYVIGAEEYDYEFKFASDIMNGTISRLNLTYNKYSINPNIAFLKYLKKTEYSQVYVGLNSELGFYRNTKRNFTAEGSIASEPDLLDSFVGSGKARFLVGPKIGLRKFLTNRISMRIDFNGFYDFGQRDIHFILDPKVNDQRRIILGIVVGFGYHLRD